MVMRYLLLLLLGILLGLIAIPFIEIVATIKRRVVGFYRADFTNTFFMVFGLYITVVYILFITWLIFIR